MTSYRGPLSEAGAVCSKAECMLVILALQAADLEYSL